MNAIRIADFLGEGNTNFCAAEAVARLGEPE